MPSESPSPEIAAEVLELGQSLFDLMLDAASPHADATTDDQVPFPTELARETACEFFRPFARIARP